MTQDEPDRPATPAAPRELSFLNGGGELGALMRGHDWSTSPLGVPETWPQPLRTIVALMLGSRYPMFVAWGPKLAFLYNDGYRPIFGAKHPDALGLPFQQVWSEIWDDIWPLIERALAGEATYNENLHLVMERHGYREDTWYTFSYSPVRDEHGEIAGMFCSCTETTKQVLLEEQLRESEARFRLIADSAPVPIWVTKLDRTRSFVNRAYVDFLGIGYDEAVDFDWRAIIHHEDEARILAESAAGEASLKPFDLEGRFRRADGAWRWLRSTSQPRWGAGGEHVGFIGVAHDLTEIRQASDAMRRVNETLERKVDERTADLSAALNRLQAEVTVRERAEQALRQAQKMEAVGQLTGGIAHDFNNLLTPVIGGLEIIAGGVVEPRMKRLADAALESSRRGAKLATQLLAFSRIQRLNIAPVPVNEVIGNLRRMVTHTIGSSVAVSFELDPDAGHALCDENQLENAILNLAINARDAMAGSGRLTIATSRLCAQACADLEPGDYVCVSVSDTGAGMSAETAARATEPFFSTKPVGKGTGLGLAQVYGIARQSGGTVRIESVEGAGTTVRLLLPQTGPGAGSAASVTGSAPTAGPSGGARMLVVDDDDDVRGFLVELLREQGHKVRAEPGAEGALAALDEAPADLAVIDFAMPGMNGAQLAEVLHERHPELKILFVTGYAESEQIDAALGGGVPVLRKPFGIDALAAMVSEVLGPKRG